MFTKFILPEIKFLFFVTDNLKKKKLNTDIVIIDRFRTNT